MSDLLASTPPSGIPVANRVQNATSRTNPAAGGRQMLTPTQVMAQRTAREARKKQEEESRRQQMGGGVGVVDSSRGERYTPGVVQSGIPAVTTSRRRTENIPTTNGAGPQMAAATAVNQSQSRPQAAQAKADPNYSVHKNRTEALEKLNMPATAPARPPQQQSMNSNQPTKSVQTSSRATFPHAFERWETLSSHWEGLTGFWMRKLQANTDELSGKPIDQQMARQITDLSAAGANLFHAVVELQRLRASSERKFQRWFFETRNEQEQAQERIAELERQLRTARDTAGTTSTASVEAVKAEKLKAEELVKEMRRELSISKEEARRAWEELGRREQEERDRTIALRSGEPTSIGGVQVVPMAGAGLSSRPYASSSSHRPQTRDGPLPGGPGPSQLGGQTSHEIYSRSQTTLESPDQEQAQFTYRPGGTSPTETDPFTETARANELQQPRHGQDTQLYSQQQRSQPPTSAAAMVARNITSPSHSSGRGGASQMYEQPGHSTAIYQPIHAATDLQAPFRSGTSATDRSDPRSYVPSVPGSGSEDEYHMNPDGSYTLDGQGRRIPYNQPLGAPEEVSEEDEEDYSAEVENERRYAQQYSQRQQQFAARSAVSNAPSLPPTTSIHYTTTGQPIHPTSQVQVSPISPQSLGSAPSATSPQQYDVATFGSQPQQPSENQGNPATWESFSTGRHQHPTRLSDILEEQSGRTSPSRASYISGDYPPMGSGNGYARR